jgi:hypothetical protein
MKTRPLKIDKFTHPRGRWLRVRSSKRVWTLPLREYAAFFAPEDLKNLTDAFDATWQELSAAHPELNTEEKVALMKKKLAQRILVSATAGGVRDVETLKEQALRSLGGDFRLGEEQTSAPETV